MNYNISDVVESGAFTAERSQQNMSFTNDSDVLISAMIEQFSIPIICIIGLVGNSLSFYVFVQKSYRKSSCSVFLAMRCVSDNGFLFALMLVWSSMSFDLHLSKVFVMCQSIIFLTYVCGCMSVWLVVLVTIENYIRIAKPNLVSKLCRTDMAKFVVCVLFIIIVCCYNFPFWTMDANCSYKNTYNSVSIVRFMVYLDTFLTLIVPTILMFALMVIIVSQMFRSRVRRQRLSLSSFKSLQDTQHPITKVTKMLLAVTLTYFILNLPSHVIRIRLLLKTMVNETTTIGQLDIILQTISLQIYYLSLAVNIFVYYIFGGKFRSVFIRTVLRRCQQRQIHKNRSDESVTKVS